MMKSFDVRFFGINKMFSFLFSTFSDFFCSTIIRSESFIIFYNFRLANSVDIDEIGNSFIRMQTVIMK